MAGETPRAGKARKKRISWQDDRSTAKYYESGDQSVIQNRPTAADSRLKPGQLPQPLNARLPRQDDRRADKYYANAVPPPPTLQQIQRGQTRQAQPIGTPRPTPAAKPPQSALPPLVAKLDVIENVESVNPSLELLVDQLHQGAKAIVLCVKAGDSTLLRRTRAALEMLVTRERITEEMYHEVRLSYAPSEADKAALDAKLGAPQPAGEKNIDAEEADANTIDPAAFLRGEATLSGDEDLGVDMDKTKIQIVDTSADVQDSPAPSYPAAPQADDDDDDSDFLAPSLKEANAQEDKPVESTGEVAVSQPEEAVGEPELPSSIETPAEAMPGIGDTPKPKKPGRRGGRGS